MARIGPQRHRKQTNLCTYVRMYKHRLYLLRGVNKSAFLTDFIVLYVILRKISIIYVKTTDRYL